MAPYLHGVRRWQRKLPFGMSYSRFSDTDKAACSAMRHNTQPGLRARQTVNAYFSSVCRPFLATLPAPRMFYHGFQIGVSRLPAKELARLAGIGIQHRGIP